MLGVPSCRYRQPSSMYWSNSVCIWALSCAINASRAGFVAVFTFSNASVGKASPVSPCVCRVLEITVGGEVWGEVLAHPI